MPSNQQAIFRKLQRLVQEHFNPPPEQLTDLHCLREYFQKMKSWENISKYTGIPLDDLVMWYRGWFKRRISDYISDSDLFIIKTEVSRYLINHDDVDDMLLDIIRLKVSHKYSQVLLVQQALACKNQLESMFSECNAPQQLSQLSHNSLRGGGSMLGSSLPDFSQKPAYMSLTNQNTGIMAQQNQFYSSLLSLPPPQYQRAPMNYPVAGAYAQFQKQSFVDQNYGQDNTGYFNNSFYYNAERANTLHNDNNNMLLKAQMQQIADKNISFNQTLNFDLQPFVSKPRTDQQVGQPVRRQGFVLPRRPANVYVPQPQSFLDLYFNTLE